jgi:hypothetical protein
MESQYCTLHHNIYDFETISHWGLSLSDRWYQYGVHCHCVSLFWPQRCWDTLYMYDKDLQWVWSGWVALIISNNSMTQVRSHQGISYCHHCDCETKHISGCWGCILMTTAAVESAEILMYKVDLTWVCTPIITCSIIQVRNRQNLLGLLPILLLFQEPISV